MHGRRSPVPYLLLACLSAAWLGGIAAAATFGAGAWPIAPALAATLTTLAIIRRSTLAAAYAALLPLIMLGAIAWERASHAPPGSDAVAQFNDGVAMRVRGTVRDDPVISDTTQRFAVDARAVQRGGVWHGASGGVLVTAPLHPRYRAGDVLEIEGALASPPHLDGFDYAAYLERRDIHSVAGFPRVRLIDHHEAGQVRRLLRDVRGALADGIERALPEPQAALAKGVLLGERSALPKKTLDDLNASNTSHLVVVSGGNVVLVATFCTLALTWFVRRRQAMVLAIIGVVLYAALVGFSPPVTRATIMGVLLVLAGVSGRRTNGLTSVLFAAALMAAWDPRVVRDVSFQLSFAATSGIIWLASPLRRGIIGAAGVVMRRDEVPRWFGAAIAEPASVTIAAVIATAPLMALHFERVSLVALPANMLIVPVFPFLLLASLLAAIGGMMGAAPQAFGAPAYFLLEYWLAVAGWFARLPGATMGAGRYGAAAAIATYAALLAIAPRAVRLVRNWDAPALEPTRPWRWRVAARRIAFAAPALALVLSLGWIAGGSAERRLEVTILNVGQGDAILIETPGGADVLIDGGPGPAVLRGLGGELPWDDRSLDMVVLTHAEADHATGLLDVLDRYDASRVVLPGAARDAPLGRHVLARASADGASVVFADAGTAWDLGGGVTLEALWPPPGQGWLPDGQRTPNNSGLVLRLRWRDVSYVFAADIEAAAEETLAAGGRLSPATVLKVAHHGSKTSSAARFLDALRPAVAVISAGDDNRFGHPAQEVVDRLGQYAHVLTTAQQGHIEIDTDGHRVYIDTSR